jgi:YidC/Oxa1 family membrane protein insertase
LFLLTQNSGTILGPIAKVLGWIFNGLFEFTSQFGILNVGLSIIIFTVVIKLFMLPLTVKQMKFSKLSNLMNPEIKAIQKKYEGKTSDTNAAMKMNEETKAVYEKYGVSPTGGCLQMIIQLPILFALYRVMQNIPAYVTSVKVLFENMLAGSNGLMAQENFAQLMADNGFTGDFTTLNTSIDAMNAFTSTQWEQVKQIFPACAGIITENVASLEKMYNFFGINLAVAPTFASISVIIPILTALSQWISMKTVTTNNAADDSDNPAMQSMKTMNTVMPIMTGFIAFSLPAGLGVYWIATAVCQTVQQLALNVYFDKMDLNKLVESNIEKANAKRAKKGLPQQKYNSTDIKSVVNNNNKSQKAQDIQKKLEETRQKNLQKVEEIKKESAESNSGQKLSIAQKANMVSQYNEKNKK